jgi:hypothetical protein
MPEWRIHCEVKNLGVLNLQFKFCSGPTSADKVPVAFLPSGLQTLPDEGFGEGILLERERVVN